MALVAKAHHIETAHDGPGFRLYRWTLGPDETGEPVLVAAYTRKTAFFIGSFGEGALGIELSPDPGGSAWVTASDPHGTRLTGIRSPRAETVSEHAVLLRPVAGPGVEQVAVWLVLA